jgi:hypothetical protein
MTTIFSHLGVNDTDRGFLSTIGQDVFYGITMDYVRAGNEEIVNMETVFVNEETELFKERFKLTATGKLQKVRDGAAPARARTVGYWDVAYPLESNQDNLAITRVGLAYMTAMEVQKQIDDVILLDINTRRDEILFSLLNNTARTWTDDSHGNLTVQPLANGDTVVYPPVLGTTTEATEDHYLVAGYTGANINDTNNPYATIRDELTHHFGRIVGGPSIVSFIHPDQRQVTEALTNFYPVLDRFIKEGADTDVPDSMIPGPGEYIGRTDGNHVKVWDWVPTGYIVSVHLEAPAPLKRRVDPADTGLPRGLTLVNQNFTMPINNWYWDDRFGFGVGNRLNGVITQLKASGSYDIPSGYS